MNFLTLTTDFGSGDDEAGVLKGVIWSIAPDAQIADLSHEVTRHNILEGALLLERCTPYFPEGSIHVAVIDPGVGTDRRAIAARLGGQCFVGPDNGLITLMLRRAQSQGQPVEIVHLDRPQYWLPAVSDVFHGRDVFAPAAAHLANGVPLLELGTPISDPLLLTIPEPQRTSAGWVCPVVAVDHFGNLSTRIRPEQIEDMGMVVVRIKGRQIHGLVHTFGERPAGELVALFNSAGFLDISVVNGNAAQTLGAAPGDVVEIYSL